MDISLFMKLQKRVRELEQERKRLQISLDKMEELAKRRVRIFNPDSAVPHLRGGVQLFERSEDDEVLPPNEVDCFTSLHMFYLPPLRRLRRRVLPLSRTLKIWPTTVSRYKTDLFLSSDTL